MNKRNLLFFLILLMFKIGMAQENDSYKKADLSLQEVRKTVKLTDDSYDYLKQLLIYYYNNQDLASTDKKIASQIKENVLNKLIAKLNKEDYEILYESWLKQNIK